MGCANRVRRRIFKRARHRGGGRSCGCRAPWAKCPAACTTPRVRGGEFRGAWAATPSPARRPVAGRERVVAKRSRAALRRGRTPRLRPARPRPRCSQIGVSGFCAAMRGMGGAGDRGAWAAGVRNVERAAARTSLRTGRPQKLCRRGAVEFCMSTRGTGRRCSRGRPAPRAACPTRPATSCRRSCSAARLTAAALTSRRRSGSAR